MGSATSAVPGPTGACKTWRSATPVEEEEQEGGEEEEQEEEQQQEEQEEEEEEERARHGTVAPIRYQHNPTGL